MAGELLLIAGPNGAGKSTLAQSGVFQEWFVDVVCLNPDLITQARLRLLGYSGFKDAPTDDQEREFKRAAEDVATTLEVMVHANGRIAVETVLSTEKYQGLVKKVLKSGGDVRMVYVVLSSPDLHIARVAARVRQGGHNVPEDKIRQRWSRSLQLFPWFASHCRDFLVFDNSDSTPNIPPRLVAVGQDGRVIESNEPFPELRDALALVAPAL